MKAKRLLISCFALLTAMAARADVRVNATNFPDANFRNWVLAQSYGSDRVLTEDEMAGVAVVDVSESNIQSLKGIEYFTALEALYCSGNQLTVLDLSKNAALEELDCSNNQLTSLNVSGCVALVDLSCFQNQLKGDGMDVLVESLPTVSGGVMNVFSNTNEQNEMTPGQVTTAKGKGWTPMYLDQNWNWSEYVTTLTIDNTNFPDANFRNWVRTVDSDGDNKLSDDEIATVTSIDLSYKGIKTLQGIEYFGALTKLSCNGNNLTALDVSKNTALTELNCLSNQLTSLDVSGCSALTKLDCCWNKLTLINVSQVNVLKELCCYNNQLTTIDVSQCTALTRLDCQGNQLTSVNVSGCTALTKLRCQKNQLTTLDLSSLTSLIELDCSQNQLTALDVSGCPKVYELYCYCNRIKGDAMTAFVESLPDRRYYFSARLRVIYNQNEQNEMTAAQVATAKAKSWTAYAYNPNTDWYEYYGNDVTGIAVDESNFPDENFRNWILRMSYGADEVLVDAEIAKVKTMDMSNNNIQSLKGIEFFTALEKLTCNDNQLTSLDISSCTQLGELRCERNQLTSLDVSGCTALKSITCYQNRLTGAGMDALVESLPAVASGEIKAIYNEQELNEMTVQQVAGASAKGWIALYYYKSIFKEQWYEYLGNDAVAEDVEINETNFPDEKFRNWLLTQSYGKDGVLSRAEQIYVADIFLYNEEIQNLKGIEYFVALVDLSCGKNMLTELDLSNNTMLQELSCGNNQLKSINLSKNNRLTNLYCYSNQLTTFDVSNSPMLIHIECFQNQIKGEGMDALIESLPNVINGHFYVIYGDGEQNEMTAFQVDDARGKGWTARYSTNGLSWAIYNGSDPDGIKSIDEEQYMMYEGTIYNLAGQRLQKMQKGINIVNGKKVLVK